MRSALSVLVLVCMVSISIVKADFDSFPVCTSVGTQDTPAVDGSIAVWADSRLGSSNWDIYGYDFAASVELPICLAGGHQKFPAVSGSIVVWQDERNGNKDIYGYDIATGEELVICTQSANQVNPEISGLIVVWQEYRNGNYDIYGCDLSKPDGEREFVICDNTAGQFYPAIDYPWVVWADNRNGNFDIYAKNLETGQEVPVCTDAAEQFYPDVSGGVVVWRDNRNAATDTDIYGRVLPDGEELEICVHAQRQMNPMISGSLVVWEDYRTGVDYDIYVYDLDSGICREVTTEEGEQRQPAIDGDRILWQQNNDIYGAQMPVTTTVTVLSPNGAEMFQAGSAIDVLWQVSGGTPETVTVALTSDDGQNWIEPVLTVSNTGSCQLTLPADVDSDQCRIRVADAANPLASDVSDAVFTVFVCDPALTADLSGDCLVNLEDWALFATQWLQCGNRFDSNWCFE